MVEREVNGGRVEIELGGRQLYLEPSLEACLDIAALGGDFGIQRVIARCEAFHFETIVRVIGAGLIFNGKRLNAQQVQKLLPEDIYKAGIFKMRAKAIEFCTIVLNGGLPISDEDEEDDEEDEEGGPFGSLSESSTADSSSEPLAG